MDLAPAFSLMCSRRQMIAPASPPEPIEIRKLGEIESLVDRIFGGEVFIMRQGLQQVGLFDELIASSLEGIRESVGEDFAEMLSAEIQRRTGCNGPASFGPILCVGNPVRSDYSIALGRKTYKLALSRTEFTLTTPLGSHQLKEQRAGVAFR